MRVATGTAVQPQIESDGLLKLLRHVRSISFRAKLREVDFCQSCVAKLKLA